MTSDGDRSIEHLLRRTRSSDPEWTSDCLDAETLAAFADDTLTAPARREAEVHLADCDRCQALTAAMVRAEAAAGAVVHEAAWKRRALGWLVPSAAVATAVALWVLVPGQRPEVAEQPVSDRQAAVAEVAIPPEAPPAPQPDQAAASTSAPVDARLSELARRREVALGSASVSPPASPGGATTVEQLLKAEESATSGARADNEARRQEQAQVEQTPVAGGPPPLREAAAVLEPLAVNESAARQGADQAARTNETAKPAAPAPAGLIAQSRAAAAFEIISPNSLIRWRVGPGPVVQHSTNGGASWTAQQIGVAAQLTAGSSPSPDVCWLVGRSGIVLRTVDAGREWHRIPFPDSADVTAITASTALDATVTLSDGRRLSTLDGGKTWAPAL